MLQVLKPQVQVQVPETNYQVQPKYRYTRYIRPTIAEARKSKLKHETCGLLV